MQTPDLEFDESYEKNFHGITAEVQIYESSMQSIINQMSLVRAVQEAVNSGDGPGAEKVLLRLATEVYDNQKYIRANKRMNQFLIMINQFRLKDCTQNLALQNLDNVLYEVMYQNFESLGEAVAMEDPEFMELFKSKKASEDLIE